MVVAVVGNGFGRGDNIRILVGVVKSKGDLAALVEHIRRQQIQLAGGAVVLGIPEGSVAVSGNFGLAIHLFGGIEQLFQSGLLQLLYGRIVGKSLVVDVQACVHDTDEHSLALIIGIVGVSGYLGRAEGLAQGGSPITSG